MGKVAFYLALAVIIQLALVIFTGQYALESDPTQNSSNATMSITTLVLNPQSIVGNTLFQYLNVALFAFGIAAIVAGLYFVRNEWIVYAGIGGVFFSFGFSYYNFWQYMASAGKFGGADKLIFSLLLLPLLIGFAIAILDWTRGRD